MGHQKFLGNDRRAGSQEATWPHTESQGRKIDCRGLQESHSFRWAQVCMWVWAKLRPGKEQACSSHGRKLDWQQSTEQTFRPCGRRRGWDVLKEQHWNKYTIKGETDHQPRLDAWDKCSGLVHWKTQKDGIAREVGGGSGCKCKYMADSCMAKTTTIL